MISYDGTYRLRARNTAKAPSGDACAWRLRIIDLSVSRPEVRHLRPLFVVATPTGNGIFKSSCAETLGKRICRDFDLVVEEAIWVEYFPRLPEKMYVAAFKPKYHWGPQTFYSIHWRPIRWNELETIRPFIPETNRVSQREAQSGGG